ncbi:hypothetical protein SNOG_01039 [Parastagonospora nodorum SN15]|uniref:Uncharacterized protein n=1 Tax=Phaeosphaeria nodorum (strain SN15 / ATCC MYA-4574 / FGSC 10173) TaxID=321614 RepID=Q0V4M5_PHANO|nr:hypothetical protein SNOG_01039 [Parastagonospora nodorum SN15]EAT92534.1 hypothetical protein SNOG_01039 [Parastagonospora nodorum SN15]
MANRARAAPGPRTNHWRGNLTSPAVPHPLQGCFHFGLLRSPKAVLTAGPPVVDHQSSVLRALASCQRCHSVLLNRCSRFCLSAGGCPLRDSSGATLHAPLPAQRGQLSVSQWRKAEWGRSQHGGYEAEMTRRPGALSSCDGRELALQRYCSDGELAVA